MNGCDNGGVDEHPELDGYEPFERSPMRSLRSRRLIRGAALLGIALLVLPIVASQASVAAGSATHWCGVWVNYEINEPARPDARFEVFGPGFLGWECYASGMIDGEQYVGYLGIIPGPPNLDDGRVLVARAE